MLIKAEDIVIPHRSRGRLTLVVEDNDFMPYVPDAIRMVLQDESGTKLAELGDTELDNPSPGVYTYTVDSSTMDHPQELTALWEVDEGPDGELATAVQRCSVIPSIIAMRLKDFRLLIDKSRKFVDPYNDTFLGYTDAQLLSYLEGGMATINSYQPGNVAWSLEGFPWRNYGQVGLESGLLVGVMSQQLYAVDTDIPNYSDQGTSFVLAHQPQLAAFFNQVAQRLDRMIPAMKLNFVNSGTIHTKIGPSFRFHQLIAAAPGGAAFRGIHFGH